jgi:hypothetical protein
MTDDLDVHRSLKTLEEYSFESLAAKLRAKETVMATEALQQRALGVSGAGGTQARVLLSAYMMVAQPQVVFTDNGEIEQVCVCARAWRTLQPA